MKLTTVLFMIIILSVVWGGFVYSLVIAIKKETKKRIRIKVRNYPIYG